MTPYCKYSVSHDICTNNNVRFHNSKTTSADYCNFIEDETRYVNKPWFDESLIRLYTSYKSTLRSFNQFRSSINHTLLIQRRKLYKDNEARKKRAYFQKDGKMLSQMRKTDSKTFFSKLRKKKQCIPTYISMSEFYNHFESLSNKQVNDINGINADDIDIGEAVFDELDYPITIDEIERCINKLKRGKSHGDDCILNEYLIEFKDILLPLLHDLFNNILDSGFFPETWAKAVIMPVFKKGSINDVKNYRGISLLSCLSKLFTSVLNQRLLLWSEQNDVLTDAQFGFRPGYGTIDAIFVLNSIISQTLCKKKRLYCAFVDFKTAFDSINRFKLWLKLSKIGIKGKLLQILYSMYSNVKSCVTVRGYNSEYFRSMFGLMQGEVLSPILFSFYVNDFEREFIASNCIPYELGQLNLFLLLYADDMILFSETVTGLQNQLNKLSECAASLDLTVNIKKTKIVIFRNSHRIKDNEKFYFDNCELDIVDPFKYLGLCFYYNGKFNFAEKQLASQGRKALFALYKNINDMYLNVESSLSLFDTYIGSVLQYASEIWGIHRGNCVEKVQLDFCKRLLRVKKSTCNVMIYSELGRLPLHVIRKFKILKYWVKILSTDNCILQQCYQEMLINIDTNNWLSGVRDILCELGLLNIWYSQNVNSDILHQAKVV